VTDQMVRPTTGLHVSDRFDEVMARIDELDPLLRAEAGDNEEGFRLTPEVEEALHASGLYAMSMPRELDGMELAPRQVIAAIEALARADASTGWVVMTL
jgi:indole-3-acetate monooxygenase